MMLVLAELTGKFGRVSTMASIVAIITRVIRRSASLYVFVVGLGYALGGLTFDILFFLPVTNNLEGKKRKIYLLIISSRNPGNAKSYRPGRWPCSFQRVLPRLPLPQ